MNKQARPVQSPDKPRNNQQASQPPRPERKSMPTGKQRPPDQPGAAGFSTARADEDTYD